MGFYSRAIFPRLYDCVMDKPVWKKYRRQQLSTADGDILEIGVGTGLNLPHYPERIRRIVTVDPNPGMNRKLQRRTERSGIKVDTHLISSESLPFDDETFDCIVSTMTLCSIASVHQAMQELFRVMKPAGRILFLDHGISPDPNTAKWQHRLDWWQRRFADGCTLTLDVADVLSGVPFSSLEIENFYMEDTPRTHGYMYLGIGIK